MVHRSLLDSLHELAPLTGPFFWGFKKGPIDTADQAVVQAVVIMPQLDTLSVGERIQLVASAHSSSGAVVSSKFFSWSSSNDAIASVSSAGLVTAHASGSVVIAARTDNTVGTANVVVIPQR